MHKRDSSKQTKINKTTTVNCLIHIHQVSDLSFEEAVMRKGTTAVLEIMITSTYPTESRDGFRGRGGGDLTRWKILSANRILSDLRHFSLEDIQYTSHSAYLYVTE